TRLQAEADRAMEHVDALILPATAIVAPPIASAHEVREPLSRFTRPFNTTLQPVAVVPVPVGGLPVGIQVAGRTNSETLRAAACGHGLQFVPDLSRALAEARRVLRPLSRFAASVPLNNDHHRPWQVIDEVVDRWLPPAPAATDQQPTRSAVADPDAFREAAMRAGFVEARVELIEERVHWASAEQLVGLCMSWWDLAARVERLDVN